MAERFLSRMRWPSRGDLVHWTTCLLLVAFLWWMRAGLWALDVITTLIAGDDDNA